MPRSYLKDIEDEIPEVKLRKLILFTLLEEEFGVSIKDVKEVIKYTDITKIPNTKDFIEGVIVGKGAIIGANSSILPGIKIGEFSLIGAGSVVTQDVPAKKVLSGNPARVIDDIDNLKYPDGGKAYNE